MLHKHVFVAAKDVFCRDKHVFVATKMILVGAPANDKGQSPKDQLLDPEAKFSLTHYESPALPPSSHRSWVLCFIN